MRWFVCLAKDDEDGEDDEDDEDGEDDEDDEDGESPLRMVFLFG